MDSMTRHLSRLTPAPPARARPDGVGVRIQGFDFRPAENENLTAADYRLPIHIGDPIVIDAVDGAVLNNPVGGIQLPNLSIHPNDLGLVQMFLRRKLKGHVLPVQFIYDHSDVFGSSPMRLCEEDYWHNAVDDDRLKLWIFFSPSRKTAGTDGGFWKMDAFPPPLRVVDRRSYWKRKWSYFIGTEESNRPTGWIMHEYYSTKYQDWVLCKIFNRKHNLLKDFR